MALAAEETPQAPPRGLRPVACVAVVLGLILGVALWGRRDSPPHDVRIVPHEFVVAPDRRDELLRVDRLQEAIESGTAYLVASCGDDGRFDYCRDLNRPRYRSPAYNVLRHAGAIYALCQRHAWRPDEDVSGAVQRAVAFLQRETFRRLPGRDDLLAIWSPPGLIGGDGPLEAKLGGTGLGLVALLGAESIQPGLTQAGDLLALGDFLLFMQRPDGSFYCKFVPASGGRRADWISLYYPGEAALGLVRLYESSQDQRFYDAALRGLLYLSDSRRGEAEVPADHWALLATAELLGVADGSVTAVQRQRLQDHAAQICHSILAQRQGWANSPYTLGAFTDDGRTTPTATRVEGLLAALDCLPPQPSPLRGDVESACTDAVCFLLAAQCREGPFAGAIPRSVGRLRPLWGASTRRFNARAAEVRVDYVQHALSAWIQYVRHKPVVSSAVR